MPARSEYGSNPWAGRNPNDDNGWGGYQWPAGVPARLLGTASYKGAKSTARCQCRVELVELFQLVWEIADKVYGYTVFGSPNPSGEPTWGPWGYENRPIGGTRSASNHSRGRAMDVNAPRNAQSYVFQSDMPVAMVRAIESLGFYWGGRYGGGAMFDAMHFEYIGRPSDVAASVARARAMLGTTAAPAGSPDAADWFASATVEQLWDGIVYAVAS